MRGGSLPDALGKSPERRGTFTAFPLSFSKKALPYRRLRGEVALRFGIGKLPIFTQKTWLDNFPRFSGMCI